MICAKKVHITETVSRRHRDTFCHRGTARLSMSYIPGNQTAVCQDRRPPALDLLSDCSSYVRRLAPQDVRYIRTLAEMRPTERASHPCRCGQKEVVMMWIFRFVYLRGEQSELHRQQKETNYEFLYVQLAKVAPCEGSDHLQADFISQSESGKWLLTEEEAPGRANSWNQITARTMMRVTSAEALIGVH